jgi:hypothetical protein
MAKYMLIMRATDEAVAAYQDIPFEQVIEAMGRYNEEMMKAGVILAGEGLTDASEGFVVDFSAEPPLVTDGPSARVPSSRCDASPRSRISRRTTSGSRRRPAGVPSRPSASPRSPDARPRRHDVVPTAVHRSLRPTRRPHRRCRMT